jgi:hypothetical protein
LARAALLAGILNQPPLVSRGAARFCDDERRRVDLERCIAAAQPLTQLFLAQSPQFSDAVPAVAISVALLPGAAERAQLPGAPARVTLGWVAVGGRDPAGRPTSARLEMVTSDASGAPIDGRAWLPALAPFAPPPHADARTIVWMSVPFERCATLFYVLLVLCGTHAAVVWTNRLVAGKWRRGRSTVLDYSYLVIATLRALLPLGVAIAVPAQLDARARVLAPLDGIANVDTIV